MALLENKKQNNTNITVRVLDNNQVQIKEQDTNNLDGKGDKIQLKKLEKIEKEGASSVREKGSQPTVAYTGKSTTENFRNTKNSVFRMTTKDNLGHLTRTSDFPQANTSGKMGKSRKQIMKEDSEIKSRTLGDGFGIIKLQNIGISKTYDPK